MIVIISIVLGVILVLALLIIYLGHRAFTIIPTPNVKTPESLGAKYQDVYYPNANQEALHAWWIPHSEAGEEHPSPTLILIHGWGRNAERMLNYYRVLSDLPVNFLIPDGRGHGQNSPNNFITQLGFSRDLIDALDWLVLKPEVDVRRIGIIGHSFGAAAALFTASIDKRLSLVVADSSYAHPFSVIKRKLKEYSIPMVPAGWLLKHYIQFRMRMTFDRIAPVESAKEIQSPGLLIHGNTDTVTPVTDSDQILTASGENFRRVIADGANHSDTIRDDEVIENLRNFITEHFLHPAAINNAEFNRLLRGPDTL